jgi:Ferritin-like domain
MQRAAQFPIGWALLSRSCCSKPSNSAIPNGVDSKRRGIMNRPKSQEKPRSDIPNRRAFLKTGAVAAGVATLGGGLLGGSSRAFAEESSGHLTSGDASILRFLAAAEIIETDLWQQYAELGGTQDSELPGLTGGSPQYTAALSVLDGDMAQYIHDNTEDELTHEVFINAYLASKGADTVNLDQFRNLPSSRATGAQQIGRLTNLMQLSVDTSWWTRYRSRTQNPDFGDTFPNAVPTLAVGQHTAIPRTDDDLQGSTLTQPSNHLQAIANTAGFHFAFVEQGGSSLYPALAQRVTSVEVLRIVLSIGGTEIAHFQTWHDKAGNAIPLTDVDPVTGVKVTFPNLQASTSEDLKANLIMPEPCPFLHKHLPACSIIRPTETRGIAMGALKALTADGLFIGQSPQFFAYLRDLAEDADEARRELD